MKRLFTYVVAGFCLVSGCTRSLDTGTVTAIDDLDAAADVADVVLPVDASAADLADAPSPSGNDLCGPENALLPNEGEPCAVADSAVCGKAEAVTKPTPGKYVKPSPPPWAAALPAEVCWRPQILRCKPGPDGVLRWVGEWCGQQYVDIQNDAMLQASKKSMSCSTVDGQASCCPNAIGLGVLPAYRCYPAVRGRVYCGQGQCGLVGEITSLNSAYKPALAKMPKDFAGCLMWFSREYCPGSECQVPFNHPDYDIPWRCEGFPGKCIQVDDYTTTCDLSGCEGLNPPQQQGQCQGLVLVPDAGGQPFDAGP